MLHKSSFFRLQVVGRAGLLLFFPIGYLLTYKLLKEHAFSYFLLNLFSFIGIWLILAFLKRITPQNIIIIVLILIFIFGYFFKFYYLIYNWDLGLSDSMFVQLFGWKMLNVITLPRAYDAFVISSVSFIVFSLVSVVLLNIRDTSSNRTITLQYHKLHSILIGRRIVVVALILGTVSTVLRYVYDLGIPGSTVVLPYKLQGIISVLNLYVTPPLFGLALMFAMHSSSRPYIRNIVLIFLLWNALQFILFTSKQYLIFPLLWLYLSGIITGVGVNYYKKFLILGGVIFLSIFPFFGAYRSAIHGMHSNIGADIFAIMSIAVDEIFQHQSVIDVLFQSVLGIISRVVGFSELIYMTILYDISQHDFLPYMQSSFSAGNVLTVEVGSEGTGFAASMLGQAFYSTGSIMGTAIWVGLWTVASFFISMILLKRKGVYFQTIWIFWIISATFWSIDELGLGKIIFFIITSFTIWLMMKLTVVKGSGPSRPYIWKESSREGNHW